MCQLCVCAEIHELELYYEGDEMEDSVVYHILTALHYIIDRFV
jgi:hypothetical protein